MTTNYHTPIPSSPKRPANAATFNLVFGELDAAIGLGGGGADASDEYLLAHFVAAMLQMTAAPTYDVTYTDVIKTVAVEWPDGSAGVFTATTINATWLEATAFALTHADSGKTLTGSGLVRNAAGQIATQMSFVVS
jgi:hypothetical protein